jgi:ribosome maturation factor RimP
MDFAEQIKQIAETSLVDPTKFVVDVVVSARKGPRKVMVLIDGDNGVSIDDCALLSREISKTLDEMDSSEDDPYTLEVSTPGVDYPLKFKRQYKKNIGRRLRVKLPEKTIEGKLEAVTDEQITIAEERGTGKKQEIQTVAIDFSQIEKAFVLVSFK